ncbi:hypothetical protein LP7551_04159 [Roseibium album]|nr:hypothetical protein LP7551_04159 [Roseibium album]
MNYQHRQRPFAFTQTDGYSNFLLGPKNARRKIHLLILICLLFVFTESQVLSYELQSDTEPKEIRIACGPLPAEFLDKQGNKFSSRSYRTAVVQSLANLGLKVNLIDVPWARAKIGVKNAVFDGMCACAGTMPTEENMIHSAVVGRASVSVISNVRGLKRLKVFPGRKLAVAGLAIGSAIEDFSPDNKLHLVGADYVLPLEGYESAHKMIHLGRLDAVIAYSSIMQVELPEYEHRKTVFFQELWKEEFRYCLASSVAGVDRNNVEGNLLAFKSAEHRRSKLSNMK